MKRDFYFQHKRSYIFADRSISPLQRQQRPPRDPKQGLGATEGLPLRKRNSIPIMIWPKDGLWMLRKHAFYYLYYIYYMGSCVFLTCFVSSQTPMWCCDFIFSTLVLFTVYFFANWLLFCKPHSLAWNPDGWKLVNVLKFVLTDIGHDLIERDFSKVMRVYS